MEIEFILEIIFVREFSGSSAGVRDIL